MIGRREFGQILATGIISTGAAKAAACSRFEPPAQNELVAKFVGALRAGSGKNIAECLHPKCLMTVVSPISSDVEGGPQIARGKTECFRLLRDWRRATVGGSQAANMTSAAQPNPWSWFVSRVEARHPARSNCGPTTSRATVYMTVGYHRLPSQADGKSMISNILVVVG